MNTTSSLRLLLEDFLGLMREEGELDVFLTLLLSAMGHEIVYRAQKGVRQYGVDLSSVGVDEEDGRTKLFLWVVKRGDIGRTEWNSGPQTVVPSLNDLTLTYLQSHVHPQHASLPRKAVVLTNGDFQSTLNHSITTTFQALSRQFGIQLETANGSRLAAWTEKYLLDEHLLPPDSRMLLRRMLANVGMPELSLRSGRELVTQLTTLATAGGGSANARKKRQLGALRGIRASLSLARIYGLGEDNLATAYKLSEFALLRTYAALHAQAGSEVHIAEELAALRVQWTEIALEYHERLRPYYQTQDALASVLPDSLLVAERAFEELGLLALQAVHWASLASQTQVEIAESFAQLYGGRVKMLLDTHSCTASPPYDRHATVIHTALLALTMLNEHATAERWLEKLIVRMLHAARNGKHWPLSTSFDEALGIRWGDEELTEESSGTSTLIPVLLTWSAAFGREDLYGFLKTQVLPAKPEWTTLNMWSSEAGYDNVVGEREAFYEHGVAEALLFVPDTGSEFLQRMGIPLHDVAGIEESHWYRFREPHIPLLAALHWGLQVPRMMLVQHASALAGARPAAEPAAP